ncbi:MAG: hypothetical protein V4446_02640 [Pseudomonadota bacterium]
MDEAPKSSSWWQTLPGILTATAGIITAVSGLLVVLYQSPLFKSDIKPDSAHSPAASVVASAPDAPDASTPQASTARINLLDPDKGGHLEAASSDDWRRTIDGKEAAISLQADQTGVYGFKNGRTARFDTFTVLIPATDIYNVSEIELSYGNDSPTGAFETIGRFKPQNLKLFNTPYQAFAFPAVTARYFKVKLLSGKDGYATAYEFQLFGTLK